MNGVCEGDFYVELPKEAKAQRDEVFLSFKKELANPALTEETKLLMLRGPSFLVRTLMDLVQRQKRL